MLFTCFDNDISTTTTTTTTATTDNNEVIKTSDTIESVESETSTPTPDSTDSGNGECNTDNTLLISQIKSQVDSVLSTVEKTLVGKSEISVSMDHITVTLPYHVLDGALNNSILNVLGAQLADVLGRNVELIFIRLSAPYLDADILAEFLSKDLVISTFRRQVHTFSMMMKKTIHHVTQTPKKYIKHGVKDSTMTGMLNLPGSIIGVKVQLSGRLMTQRTLPRTIVQSASIGNFQSSPYQSLQSGSYTIVNKKGTYTVKVWLSVQN